MSRTLEEQISSELDTLWQAALFLTGGVEQRAEPLLLHVITLVSHEDPGALEREDGTDVLERFMLRQFFDQPLRGGDSPPRSTSSCEGVDPDVAELLNDAGAVPDRARPALWLVLVRRRSYEEAAEVLGIEGDTLRELLGYRDVLMARVAARSGGRVPGDPEGGSTSREGAS
ncbi:MAG: hypothetical protein U5R14_03580 [Gemmatimonadota bacterium]|nr:hypothetical protein [Gemmatimonadota bacterium]